MNLLENSIGQYKVEAPKCMLRKKNSVTIQIDRNRSWLFLFFLCLSLFLMLILIFLIKVQLIYNVSGIQQSDIHIYVYIYTYIIFQNLFHYRLLQDIEYSLQNRNRFTDHRKQT